MIIIGRKCTLISNSYDFHVCGRSSVGECTCVCVKFLSGVYSCACRCIAGVLIRVMEKKRYWTYLDLLLVEPNISIIN